MALLDLCAKTKKARSVELLKNLEEGKPYDYVQRASKKVP
jgi:hypothetical protein